MSVLIIKIICTMLENIAMIASISFAVQHFNRFSLLWFLLIPAARSVSLSFLAGEDAEDDESN